MNEIIGPVCPEGCGDSSTNVYGVELQGVYDGVAYWGCKICGTEWHRWTGPGRIFDAVEAAWSARGLVSDGVKVREIVSA